MTTTKTLVTRSSHKMRAVATTGIGGPEVLSIREVPAPSPGPSELLLDIHATALNRADLLQRRGLYPPPEGVTEIMGLECAGIVRGLGPGTPEEWLGKRVMALLPGGGYAERVVIHERMAIEIPENLSFEEAAAIPEAFLTASEALFQEAEVHPGQRVLIHAAAGGVGSAAVQLATLNGADVLATAGTDEKCQMVMTLGAAHCVNYRSTDFAEEAQSRWGKRPVDVILDFIGGAYWEQHSKLLADGGRLISIGVLGGRHVTVNLAQVLSRRLRLLGLVMRSRDPLEKIAITQRFRRKSLHWFESGRLKPVIDSVWSLDEIAKAHARMENNANMGKIVVITTTR